MLEILVEMEGAMDLLILEGQIEQLIKVLQPAVW
jgi:hypothetical protein